MSNIEMEINEQPEVIERLIGTETDTARRIARSVRGQFHYAFFVARGSSDNAARYAQYLWGAHNQIPITMATPSLFTLYKKPPRLDGALVVAVSQSGQSPDIVEVVAEARRQGQPTIVITNTPESPLAKKADYCIDLQTGPELSLAATKTYTASLAALALLSIAIEGNLSRLEGLTRIAESMRQTIKGFAPILERVERYRYMNQSIVIGRGFNYSTAFEISLKIKELTRTIAEPYSSADFRHGPIAMVREGFPVMVIALGAAVLDDLRDLLNDLRRKGTELLVISDQPDLLKSASLAMPLPPGMDEWLSPLAAVIPGQLFAMALAQSRGLDPDHPAGLTKVTETM